MTKFKAGDKVRAITDKYGMTSKKYGWEGVVKSVGSCGFSAKTTAGRSEDIGYVFSGLVEADFELITQKPTKNQRITALEQTVADLQAEVEALKAAHKPSVTIGKDTLTISKESEIEEIASKLAQAISKKAVKSPNDQRKAIIAEAKAFVEETSTFVNTDYSWQQSPSPKHREAGTLKVKFEVNAEKRTVVALVYLKFHGGLAFKALAKCAPDDVFNADIGKAIAVGRALGLDVKRFEQAVKPTEVVVGMIVKAEKDSFFDDTPYTVEKIEDDRLYDEPGNGWIYDDVAVILDDTDAQY